MSAGAPRPLPGGVAVAGGGGSAVLLLGALKPHTAPSLWGHWGPRELCLQLCENVSVSARGLGHGEV